MEPLFVRAGLTIPAGELQVSFARSGGPGGQNVNKVETKVLLRFSVRDSEALSDAQRARLLERLGPSLTGEGELVLQSSRYRERARNLEDARERLAAKLAAALKTERRRRKTRPTRSSVERRLKEKRRRGDEKRRRRGEDA